MIKLIKYKFIFILLEPDFSLVCMLLVSNSYRPMLLGPMN